MKNEKYLIVGAGRSGIAAGKMLLTLGKEIVIYDGNTDLDTEAVKAQIGTEEDILEYIKSVSYPNAKALHLLQMAKIVVEKCDGVIPSTMEALTTLPGVGRKTANVMLAVAFGKPAMPVDTHVFRVSHRVGLADEAKNPLQTEMILRQYIPENILSDAHHWLLLHGRYVCTALAPKCGECGIRDYCKEFKE